MGTVRLLISVLVVMLIAASATVAVVGLVQRTLDSRAQRATVLRVVDNQQRTFSTLRSLRAAQRSYYGATGCFASLVELRTTNLVDESVADGIADGYLLIEEHDCSHFRVFAVPQVDTGDNRTGDLWYALTSDGRILASPSRDLPHIEPSPVSVQR